MINTDMRSYDYYLLGELNEYGAPALSSAAIGKVKMAINYSSTTPQDSIIYKESNYIGLTHGKVTDKYIIQYGNIKLKVQYVVPKGRYTQVFLADYD